MRPPHKHEGEVVTSAGWWIKARAVPSPNYDARPDGTVVDMLVIHNISLPPGEFHADDLSNRVIDDLFCNRLDTTAHPFFSELVGLRVSAHFLISRQGQVSQYVSLHERAWHAGVSDWQGRQRCNDFSIGIELEGEDDVPYSPAQYRALAELTRVLRGCFPAITDDRIVGHCDIAPGRKTDPGAAFDWAYFRSLI